jgi:hypothetical protein
MFTAPELLPLSLPSATFFIFELPNTFSNTEDVSLLRLDLRAGEFSTLLVLLLEGCFGICDNPKIEVGFFSAGRNFLIYETCALTCTGE